MSKNPKTGQKTIPLTPSVAATALIGRLNAVNIPAEFEIDTQQNEGGFVATCYAKVDGKSIAKSYQDDDEKHAKAMAANMLVDRLLFWYADELGDLADRTIVKNDRGDTTVCFKLDIGQDGDAGTAECSVEVDGETYTGSARVEDGNDRRLVAQNLAMAEAIGKAKAARAAS